MCIGNGKFVVLLRMKLVQCFNLLNIIGRVNPGDQVYCSSYFSIKWHFLWNICNAQNTFFLYRLKLIQCFNFQSLEYIAWLGSSWRSGVPFKLLQPQVTLSLEHFQCSTFICLLRMMLNSMHFFVLYSSISNRLIPILDIRYTVQDHSRSCELSWVSCLEAKFICTFKMKL